ncbi:hypothetical protein [Draconibacterium halophilum]|uniref:SprT-like family protein n=1 Tax=Draconibacterium halophilum TaxID=2706887 RepID=A0A6C0R8X4_9BACT|nr:hypothetical protein [Draconibacterium halophilum]QIA06780.1 hypothetical protein G0Q07_03105 [Draconibacterium halophilum]
MKKYVIILMLIAVLPLSFHSCQEEIVEEVVPPVDNSELTAIEKRFLDPGNLKSADDVLKTGFIAEVLNDIEKQNKAEKFIENLVEKYGYPDWEMTRFFSDEEQTVAQVAVSHDNSCETEAVILCVKHKKKLKYRLFVRDKLDRFKENKKPIPTFEKIEDLFIIFDLQKYGESSLLMEGDDLIATDEDFVEKSVSTMLLIPVCYTRVRAYSNGETGDVTVYETVCEYDYVWVGGTSDGSNYIPWYNEYNGGSGTTSVAEDNCNCDICPICKGCLNQPISLKSIPKPSDGGGETTVDCPMCSCPKVIEDPSFEDTKADCVYDKLVTSNQMQQLLSEYFGSDTYHVTYKVEYWSTPGVNSTDPSYGSAKNNGDNTVTIKINSYYFDEVAPVTTAKTILHETIHAYLYQEVNKLGGLDNLENTTFENLFAYYQTYGYPDYQHDYMSQYYIPNMAQTLRQYDNYAHGIDYYEALAWQGLSYTYGWQQKTQAEKDAINAKVNEINSGNKECN